MDHAFIMRGFEGFGHLEARFRASSTGIGPFLIQSQDGKSLVLWEVYFSPTIQNAIGVLSMEGDHARRELFDEEHWVKEPRISPNGRRMAYSSNESGKFEVYVCPFPDVKKSNREVSAGGGNHPLWSPDGRELFYNNVDATTAVPVETGPQFKLNGMPAVLFRGTAGKILGPAWNDTADYTYWGIDPTGKRLILMLKDDPAEAPRKINIVLNRFEELKGLVPAD